MRVDLRDDANPTALRCKVECPPGSPSRHGRLCCFIEEKSKLNVREERMGMEVKIME
jgi:hypothetical protein